MSQALRTMIQTLVQEVRKFIEANEPFEVFLNDRSHTSTEVWDEYARIVNYTSVLKSYLTKVDYVIFTLTDAKHGISSNTPKGSQIIQQLNSQIESLKMLRRSLCDIDDGLYRVINYYDKGGGCV